uniref:Transmembrane protein n=1 Tax=Steinernema glaseri TaxID=37863 RepID=A0A1I8A7T8_9BILA
MGWKVLVRTLFCALVVFAVGFYAGGLPRMDLGAEPALQEEMNQELGNSTDNLLVLGSLTTFTVTLFRAKEIRPTKACRSSLSVRDDSDEGDAGYASLRAVRRGDTRHAAHHVRQDQTEESVAERRPRDGTPPRSRHQQ